MSKTKQKMGAVALEKMAEVAPVASVVLGDGLEVMKAMVERGERFDSVVCDAPYGLGTYDDIRPMLLAWLGGSAGEGSKKGFMGRSWDVLPGPEYWRLCFDLLKPGGHLVTFAGSRTSDLMGVALRLAGFEVRDVVQFLWTYGSGMPKGPDLAKSAEAFMGKGCNNGLMGEPTVSERRRFKAKSQDAQAFEGWSTTLKPAYEPILLARKPLAGTVVENALEHGTGALNIGACRTPLAGASDSAAFAFNHDGSNRSSQEDGSSAGCMEGGWKVKKGPKAVREGRWPANFCHDGSPESLAMFEAFGERPGALCRSRADGTPMDNAVFGAMRHPTTAMEPRGDAGTAARFFPSLGPDEEDKAFAAEFFYGGKATRTDRDEGLEGRNSHVTVKPTNLMRWLCRLVTPPGGRVLDPFCGSGSTGKAAVLEGMAFVGIEREAAYADIARRRVAWAQQQVAPKKREAA